MDNNNIKDYLVPDEAQAETDCSIKHLSLIIISMEFPNWNIEFPKNPASKVFRSMMNESLIYYNSNKK